MAADAPSADAPLSTGLLADHPETIPQLVRWFRAEWPSWFAPQTDAMMAAGFGDEANRDRLPLRLVAFVGEELAGTVVLRDRAVSSLPGYEPGLGGLFVAEGWRGHGVGSELVRAAMSAAAGLGLPTLYAGTATARGLLERLGWVVVAQVPEVGPGQVILRWEGN